MSIETAQQDLSAGAAPALRTRVFISYSRKDMRFAEHLRDRLIEDGVDAFLDAHDIVKGEPWRERLQGLITSAHAVIFLISPSSVASEICDWEVNEAERLGKRIVPVMCEPTDDVAIPNRLKRLNYAFLDTPEKWPREYPALQAALQRDIHWVREHTRLSELAAGWEIAERREGKLLRIDEVRAARRWEASRPADTTLSGVLSDFLAASELKEAHDRDRLLTATGRAFVKPAQQACAVGEHDAALRLAAAGTWLSEDFDMRLVPERAAGIVEAAERQTLLQCSETTAGVLALMQGRHMGAFWDAETGVLLKLVTNSFGSTVAIFDVPHAREVTRLPERELIAQCSAFNSDATLLATGGGGGGVGVWDARTGENILDRASTALGILQVRFSPDSTHLIAAGSEGSARIWRIEDGREIALRHKPERVSSPRRGLPRISAQQEGDLLFDVCFSSDGVWAATACNDQTAKVWSTETGAQIFSLQHDRPVMRAVFSDNGAALTTLTNDGVARVWSSADGQLLANLGRQDGANLVVISADASRVATISNDAIIVRNAIDGRDIAHIANADGHVWAARFSDDGAVLTTYSITSGSRVWDVSGEREVMAIDGAFLGISANGEFLATRSPDRTAVHVWSVSQRKELLAFTGHEGRPSEVKFNRDCTSLLSVANDHSALLCDLESGVVETLSLPSRVLSAIFSPDQKRIAIACENGAALVGDLDEGGTAFQLTAPLPPIWTLAYGGDNARILTKAGGVLNDSVVQIWNAQTGDLVATLTKEGDRIDSAEFDASGSRIAMSRSGGDVVLFDARDGSALRSLTGHTQRVWQARFSADGSRIATAGEDRTVRIWDTENGAELLLLRGTDEFRDAMFSDDGERLLTVSLRDGAEIWDAGSGRRIKAFRAHRAEFMNGGAKLALVTNEGMTRILDVSRTEALVGDPVEILTAALTGGRGLRRDGERQDLLMQMAPDDLQGAILSACTDLQREKIEWREKRLLQTFVSAATSPLEGVAPIYNAVERSSSQSPLPGASPSIDPERDAQSIVTVTTTHDRSSRRSVLTPFRVVLAVLFLGAVCFSVWMWR